MRNDFIKHLILFSTAMRRNKSKHLNINRHIEFANRGLIHSTSSSFNTILEIIYCIVLLFILIDLPYENFPEVSYKIHVRRFGRPLQSTHVIDIKPCFGRVGSVYRRIVFLQKQSCTAIPPIERQKKVAKTYW